MSERKRTSTPRASDGAIETPFRGIVWGDPDDLGTPWDAEALKDLALDKVLEALAAGGGEGDLGPFSAPARNLEVVEYRQRVIEDLDGGPALSVVERFSSDMRTVRERLERARTLRHPYESKAWLLDAAVTYCGAIERFRDGLTALDLRSTGLKGWLGHLATYSRSEAFLSLRDEAVSAREALSTVRYSVSIDGPKARVGRSLGEENEGEAIERTFARFRQGHERSAVTSPPLTPSMNHIEHLIVDRVAILFPEAFAALDAFAEKHAGFLSEDVVRFDREVRFYVDYLSYIRPLRAAGLPFCMPTVTHGKAVRVRSSFDLPLADALVMGREEVVLNDVDLSDDERVLLISGPNQGGKTTYARMFAQIHVLASLGLLIPGRSAELPLPDAVLTHFGRAEQVADLRGRLEDDLIRVREILDRCTSRSVLVLNEIFPSTTLEDARDLGEKVLRRVLGYGSSCVFVTFIDELSLVDPAVVSMVSNVAPEDPASRTFTIVRRAADGLAYAAAIAAKHDLTYERLVERIAR